MSEYIDCETEFVDKDSLIDALVELGVAKSHIEVHETAQELVGYMGDERVQRAHVIVRRGHVGTASNDIGFEKVNGKFKAWVSDYDKRHGLGEKIFSGKIKQVYAKNQILKAAAHKHGHKVISCEKVGAKVKIKIRVS